MSIGSYTLILNEAAWIAPCILRALPYIDEMVYFDGGSTDGTVEIIQAIQKEHKDGGKIKLFLDKNPKDLKDDYTRLSDECLHSLDTDFALFLHPDMYVSNPEQFLVCRGNQALAMTCNMRSFGGDPGGELLELRGRGKTWKNIIRLRDPDLGAHYWGWYGSADEDCYFRDITGDEHRLYNDLSKYGYEIADSGLEILHFSDVRTRERRLERMKRCLKNQGVRDDLIGVFAENHPRVNFEPSQGIDFIPAQYPSEFLEANRKYEHLRKQLIAR